MAGLRKWGDLLGGSVVGVVPRLGGANKVNYFDGVFEPLNMMRHTDDTYLLQ